MKNYNGNRNLFLPYFAVILIFGILACLSGYIYITKEGRVRAQADLVGRLKFIRNELDLSIATIQKQLRLASKAGSISQIRFYSGLDYIFVTPAICASDQTNSHITKASLNKSGAGGIRKLEEHEFVALPRHLQDKCCAEGKKGLAAIVIEYSLYVDDTSGVGGYILTGGHLLSGNNEWIDRIRDAITGYNQGKDGAAASLFSGDMRISTTLRAANGTRLNGTKMPTNISDKLYGQTGLFSGKVEIGGKKYLSAYKRLDSDSPVALAIAIPEAPYLAGERTFIAVLIFLLGLSVVCTAYIALRLSKMVEKSEQELKNTNSQLEKLNSSYINMIGIVSHDLKNILSSVGLNINAVAGGHYGPLTDKQKRALVAASATIDYFERTVRNFLDYTRFEGKTPPINRENIDILSEIIRPATDKFMPEIERKGLTLVIRPATEHIFVDLDKSHMEIAVNNLLGNAVKYTPNHGMIEIVVSKAENTQIEVYNSSIPIGNENKKKLFTPFSKIESAGKKESGTGLGLYITRKIAEAHGGRIEHESSATGNTFSIIL